MIIEIHACAGPDFQASSSEDQRPNRLVRNENGCQGYRMKPVINDIWSV